MSDSEEDHKPDFGERNDDDPEVKLSDDPPVDNSDDEQEKRKKRRGDLLSDESDDENEKRKRRRSDSLSQRDVVNEREEVEVVAVQALVLKPNQKKDAPEGVLMRKSTKARNAKFMGNLLGHLGKAKKNLEKEREGDKKRCQEEVEERVFIKLREERKIIAEKRARDEEARRLQARQMKLLHQRLNKHYSHMRNFIRTKNEPAIFFLPKKHNSVTLQLLQETRDDIDRKLEMLKEDFCADDPYDRGDVRNSTLYTGWKKGYGYGSGQIAGSRDIAAAEGKPRIKRERSV